MSPPDVEMSLAISRSQILPKYRKSKLFSGIADQDITVAGVNVKQQLTKQKPRSVPLNKKANLENFKTYMLISEVAYICI